ncbi:CWF19-like protein 2 [Phoenix dactylifera]|uniref:CWF19-like protein 2 n=1 Tax=Phoenix dactylifera TaxID=42345 RepID=A0A8B7CMI9_PHODC|nr:CWF19-like protein 2 [Phoenix dactylifera]
MLSGIKFIPKDQLCQVKKSNSDFDGSDEERKDSSSRKGKHKRLKRNQKKRKSSRYDSFDEDDEPLGREMGRSESESDSSLDRDEERRSRRRRRSSRYDGSDEDEEGSEREKGRTKSDNSSSLDRNEERRSIRRRGRRESWSEDSYSSEEYEKKKKKRKKEGRRKPGKESRGKRDGGKDEFLGDEDDERDFTAQNDTELARKELGLEWMLRSGSKMDNNQIQVDNEPERPIVEEVKRTNPKELNPYLKDNGSGYPDDASISEAGNQLLPSVVGDGGASWRLKALKRAKEQAAREGRKLDDVVEERWGSLNQLAASVTASRAAPTHAHLRAIKERKMGQAESSDAVAKGGTKGGDEEVPSGNRDYLRDKSSRHPEMRKPKQDSLSWKRNRVRNMSSEDKSLIAEAMSGVNKFSNDGSFMENIVCLQRKDAAVSDDCHANVEANDRRANEMDWKEQSSSEMSSASKQVLTANQLAAKVLQLRMKGKHEEAEKLSKEMEDMAKRPDAGTKIIKQETEQCTSRFVGRQISNERKRREDDADLHLAKKITQNRKYSLSGRVDDEYDFDDAPSRKRNRKMEKVPEEKRNISARLLTQQERCQFCFENPSRPKHLIVSIGNFTYLMLPQCQPVVQGHCCILPMQHEAATRTVDKNVWEELRNFKKCLSKMFARQDKDVVFLETVIGLAKQRRHCLIECIPVPYEVAKQAPLYFKKAIEEAEDEWGQHEMKKLIPTSGNLRQVIPQNFAYFHVEFGLDRGFVHVIDDDSNFSGGFGLNVLRGLLRLPEEDMHRRRRHEPVEKQKQAVASFAREWEPFDWTKELD